MRINSVGNALSGQNGTGEFVGTDDAELNNTTLNDPILDNAVLGTPQSGDLGNCTGYDAEDLEGVTAVAHGGTGNNTFPEFSILTGNLTSPLGSLVVGDNELPTVDPLLGFKSKAFNSNFGISISYNDDNVFFDATNEDIVINYTGGLYIPLVNTVVIANSGGSPTFQLPSTAAIGDTYEIVGGSSTSWQVTCGSGQSIRFGSVSCTTSTGAWQSTVAGSCAKFRCITTNTGWEITFASTPLTYT